MYIFLVLALATASGFAQSLLDATAPYSQLSDFNDLLSSNPDIAASLLTNISSSSQQQTILVPSNDAFSDYRQRNGASVGSLSSSDVGNILNYHTLQGALSSSDIQQPGGLVSNTALTDPNYVDREVLTGGERLSQVVYISSTETATGVRIMARQRNVLSSTDVQSGEGNLIELEPTPANWSGGVFYVVNGFLTLPVNQTDTMTAQNLTSFVLGLDRTNVTEGTNAAQGLTCLCPIDAALGPLANTTGNTTDGPASLLATLTRHGLTGSYYSTNFSDGDLIYSQNGYPILVSRSDDGTVFLNDARLVGSNYIARTGAVHAVDRIMGYLNTTTNTTTPANASIFSDTANIPSPTPSPSEITSSTVIGDGGAIPTANATGNQLLPPEPTMTTTGESAATDGPAASGGTDGSGATEEATSAGTAMGVVQWSLMGGWVIAAVGGLFLMS
ncbi:MAG: hypothetical protein LQ341_005221 [Variospora aurantia]|nr:MAG: hypothetical protein LQ341_005221 [Variospora aurantia]